MNLITEPGGKTFGFGNFSQLSIIDISGKSLVVIL